MKFKFNDGGRQAAGFKGHTGDCVCRAICIAAELPYNEVYEFLAKNNAAQRKSKRTPKKGKTAAHGINVTRKWFKEYMQQLGFAWIPTMFVGKGCKVHLTDGELPMGRLIVSVSNHYTAVIDGVINDIYNPQRGKPEQIITVNGSRMMTIPATPERCVYGYYFKP